MKVDLDSIELYINYEANRVEARVEDYLCLIDFIHAGRVIVYTHTEVPPVLAERLSRTLTDNGNG